MTVRQKRKHPEMSPEALEFVAARFQVMAAPVRLRILQALDSEGEMSIGELTESLGLSQPNVSKPGFDQDLHVLAYIRLREAKRLGEIANTHLTCRLQRLKDTQAHRFGQHPETPRNELQRLW